MNPPRPSAYRNALQVSPEQIAGLNDSELSDLMRALLLAQAYRCGSPPSEIRVNTEDRAKDGGCDGWTAKPATTDKWLGDADTCWQFKTGTAGQPGKLEGEVGKPIPQQTLASGGRFVLVASGSTNGKKGERDRLQKLTGEASAAGLPTDRIAVIDSDGLARWCNQHPAVAGSLAGMPGGLQTLQEWSRADVHQAPWQPTDTLEENITQQRSNLDFETGSVKHLHIYGHPGVGKTRLALELCRNAPWSSFVIYVPQANDPGLLELISGCRHDPAVRLVVVADEAQPEHLRPLRGEVDLAQGQVRLITVGHCPTPDPSRIPVLQVHPLDSRIVRNVVKGWHPEIPPEHIDFIARFADGYMRLARLASDVVADNLSIDVRSLLSQDAIRGFLDKMLGTEKRRALHVVAVLTNVGWTEDAQVEGEAIANHLDLGWNDVRAEINDFHRQFGIVPRGGRYRYISPTPLGNYLAIEAWEVYPDLLRSLPNVLPTEKAKEAYYERLQSIASNPQTRQYAREELSFFFQLTDFVDVHDMRRWSALSSADPDLAAKRMLQALQESTVEDRAKIKDMARTTAVSTLVLLAWPSRSFADAAKSLALLAEAENETWANNATGEFLARFQVMLGGTAVPYRERFSVLDELAAEDRTPLTRLVVQALAKAGEHQETRLRGDLPSDELPENELHPSTGHERLECVLAALDRLNELAKQGTMELQDDFISAAKSLAMVLLRGSVARKAVAELFETVRDTYPDAREPLRRAIADVLHQERRYWKELPEEELAQLDELHSRFEDESLFARLQQQVGQSHFWDQAEQPDLRPLAQELIEYPSGLVEMWPWLTSGEAEGGWRLGEALAEADTDETLLSLVQDVEGTGTDLRTLCSYISTARNNCGDKWYDDWFQSQFQRNPRPQRLLFETAWRCGTTPFVAQCLREILQTEQVESVVVNQLCFGQWHMDLDATLLDNLLRTMIDTGHQTAALKILGQRIKTRPAESERWRTLAFNLITTRELIRSKHTTARHWKELALQYVDEHPGEIAAAILQEQADRSSSTQYWCIQQHHDAAHVLDACVERNPEAVWDVLQSHLSSGINAERFSIGFPHGVLDRLPADKVLAWVEANPKKRAPIAANFANKDFSNDDTLAARIVGTYGDYDDVARSFFSAHLSGSWFGPASTHWEELSTPINEIANHTKLPKLRHWAKKSVRHLLEMAQRDRQREEEEGLGRF